MEACCGAPDTDSRKTPTFPSRLVTCLPKGGSKDAPSRGMSLPRVAKGADEQSSRGRPGRIERSGRLPFRGLRKADRSCSGSFHCISTMEQVAPSPCPTRDDTSLVGELCAALLTPRSPKEMERLLTDLCTPAEIRTLAERWHVARLLDSTPMSYREIHDATGVSTTTIVRVARFLRQEPHRGYRAAIDRMTEADRADRR